jgi:hypothetical protein
MGRLLSALRAASKPPATCESGESANSIPIPSTGFASSQDSQIQRSIPSSSIRRFARFAARAGATAEQKLEALAKEFAIDWRAASSQMIDGDAEAGVAQLAADEGDGIEVAGVVMWLQLLAGRAPPGVAPRRNNGPGPGLDNYGRPLPASRRLVCCETCVHFVPDTVNPEAGVGQCLAGVGAESEGVSLHPMALRFCDGHEVATPVGGDLMI